MIEELSTGIDDAGYKDMCRPTGKPCLTKVKTRTRTKTNGFRTTMKAGDGTASMPKSRKHAR